MDGRKVQKFIANFLTSFRALLAALIVLHLLSWTGMMVALGLGLVTDQLDGWFARRAGKATWAGALADTFADRSLLAAPVIALAGAGYLNFWLPLPLVVALFAVDLPLLPVDHFRFNQSLPASQRRNLPNPVTRSTALWDAARIIVWLALYIAIGWGLVAAVGFGRAAWLCLLLVPGLVLLAWGFVTKGRQAKQLVNAS